MKIFDLVPLMLVLCDLSNYQTRETLGWTKGKKVTETKSTTSSSEST